MRHTAFIITIDTEGDDLWSRPRRITTHNAAYLPRFQALCERFGFRPVYLANHEMAQSRPFVEFARDVLARDAGEIGMHLHAWNSPPLEPLTDDDFRHQPYLIEFADDVMRRKIGSLTALLEDTLGQKMVSHRAGRWGFDGRYAALLLAEGYRVDCSVTPGINWSGNPGAPGGRGGTDYTAFPRRPYRLDPADISATSPRAGGDTLLEVPMTVCQRTLYRAAGWAYRAPVLRRVANRVAPALAWLCPTPLLGHDTTAAMFDAARAARADGAPCLELMLHSSELMPGGSPSYPDELAIERLYEQLARLFEEVSAWCCGMTLKEFAARFEQDHTQTAPIAA